MTEESQLSKFQDIEYKIFTPYSQDNSRTVAVQGKKPKIRKMVWQIQGRLSIMAI